MDPVEDTAFNLLLVNPFDLIELVGNIEVLLILVFVTFHAPTLSNESTYTRLNVNYASSIGPFLIY